MAERRQAALSTSKRATSVRRNLFHHHLSRRPTSLTSTSAETLQLDIEIELDESDIVIRDQNGDFQSGDPALQPFDDQDEAGNVDAKENEMARERLTDAVKHHQRNRNRAPSEPAELLEAVKTSLKARVAALADDNWRYEAETA